MKNKIILPGIIFLAFAITISTVAQKGKENKGNNKEQSNNGKGNKDKNNGKGNDNKGDQGNKDHNNGKGNHDKNNNGKDNNGRNDKDKDRDDIKIRMKDGFVWDTETFKDRKNIRNNMEKVTLCHKPGKDNKPGVTITVSSNALKAHMNHGDVQGNCPTVANSTFSNIFLDRRTDYYTVLQNGQEQVLYSRSILDYALERLTGARSQLVVLQNNNAPATDIERKRLLIVDLEQNVSLLQTLIGVTANIVADRLMN